MDVGNVAAIRSIKVEAHEHPVTDVMISEEFRADDSDVKIRSSDGLVFKVHQKTIDKYSEGLLGDGIPNSLGEFQLKEDRETLALLFQYMYKKRPDLGSVSFNMLRGLAEAAEIYQIDPLSDTCEHQIRLHARTYPMEALTYAVKHNLPDIADEAAPRTVGTHLETALRELGRDTFIPWVLYREKWIDIMRDVNNPSGVLHKGGMATCDLWHTYYVAVVRDLCKFGPGEVQEGSRVFGRYRGSLKGCTHCKIRAEKWQRAFVSAPERIPSFTSILSEMPHKQDTGKHV